MDRIFAIIGLILGVAIQESCQTSNANNNALRCYACADTGPDNHCEHFDTYKDAMDHKGYWKKVLKNCTIHNNKMCFIETFAVKGSTVSHIRDCSDGENFSFSSNNKTQQGVYVRLNKLLPDNETACVWDGNYQVCLTKCNGTFCNGPVLKEKVANGAAFVVTHVLSYIAVLDAFLLIFMKT